MVKSVSNFWWDVVIVTRESEHCQQLNMGLNLKLLSGNQLPKVMQTWIFVQSFLYCLSTVPIYSFEIVPAAHSFITKKFLDSFKLPNWQRARAHLVCCGKGQVLIQDLRHWHRACCQLRYLPWSIHLLLSINRLQPNWDVVIVISKSEHCQQLVVWESAISICIIIHLKFEIC